MAGKNAIKEYAAPALRRAGRRRADTEIRLQAAKTGASGSLRLRDGMCRLATKNFSCR